MQVRLELQAVARDWSSAKVLPSNSHSQNGRTISSQAQHQNPARSSARPTYGGIERMTHDEKEST